MLENVSSAGHHQVPIPLGLAHGFSILHCKTRDICLNLIFFKLFVMLYFKMKTTSHSAQAGPMFWLLITCCRGICSARFFDSSARFFSNFTNNQPNYALNPPKRAIFHLFYPIFHQFRPVLASFRLILWRSKKMRCIMLKMRLDCARNCMKCAVFVRKMLSDRSRGHLPAKKRFP